MFQSEEQPAAPACRPHPFPRHAAPPTGKQVAVIGAGPAGMACAHRLAMLGNGVTVFEARSRERMQAAPALEGEGAREQLAALLAAGRIRIEHGSKLGLNLELAELHLSHDAVFVAVGLAAGRVLGLTGDEAPGLRDAGRRVTAVCHPEDLGALAAPQRAIVIGAARGAVDTAARLKRLGAQDVTLVYRHGLEADGYEFETARASFVRIRTWAWPLEVLRDERGLVAAVRFEQTRMQDGRLVNTGGFTEIATHAVLKAVGRAGEGACEADDSVRRISREGDRIRVDPCFRTALPGVYAGGDCVAPGQEAPQALRHGRLAAQAIHADLQS
ncbi:FAD-dependent oxidoreductase [Massilia niastensis]|uniref:FAD-dependent oxidoreductase n=1 Tax=Massilia niastensis TaxID=544911 RepID=UPI0003754F6F|nr:FAD-dependent oxidoreductase [Massilia niastensis]